MKKCSAFLSALMFLFSAAIAQTDTIYTINNDETLGLGISQITGVNPVTGSGAASTSYATTDATTVGASLALATNGYLYYITQDLANEGGFTVRSIAAYPTATTTVEPTSQLALSGDINGSSTADATFRSMATAPDGSIYMTINEGSSVLYLAKFEPGPGGAATNFQMLGTITINGSAPAAALRNGDIAFDGSGNLYALINEDAPQGNATIYFVAANAISTSSAGITNLQAKYDVKNSTGTNFSDYAVGLAVASSGNFYLAIQGGTQGGVYMLTRDVNGNFIMSESPISAANDLGIADLATSYFPSSTVLPVVYGAISAQIVDRSLIVNWSTLSETNNDHFEIEVSKDGQRFTKAGTIDTKAINGNSDTAIDYNFSKTVDIPVAVMSISLLSLAIVALLVNRKNKLLFSAMMIMGVGLAFASCSKSSDQVDVSGEGKLFVRIVQVDKDGKKSTSRIITAYRAD
ncbi:MAG TPA: hypothetical protein VL943_10605 [Niabella sp.]|nr:hypothetical protein [Niabella sp.]